MAIAYVHPHDLDVRRYKAGEDSDIIGTQQYAQKAFKQGEVLVLTPRKARVFVAWCTNPRKGAIPLVQPGGSRRCFGTTK